MTVVIGLDVYSSGRFAYRYNIYLMRCALRGYVEGWEVYGSEYIKMVSDCNLTV